MTAIRRLALALLAGLGLVLGLAAPAFAAPALASPALAAPATPAGDGAADRVVVLGVAGLAWSDIDPDRTPQLWALAGDSAIGALSVRAARSNSCLLDGWATLGAGNRARWAGAAAPIPPVPLPPVPLPETNDGSDPEDVLLEAEPEDTSLSYCGVQQQVAKVGLADPQAAVALIAEDPATARFGAQPGALGAAVSCTTTIGRAATVAAAGADASLTEVDTLPPDTAELSGVLSGCPLTLVALDELADAGEPGTELSDTGTEPRARDAAVALVDRAVEQVQQALATLPGTTLLLVQGVSEVNDGRAQLHVAIAHGPGFDGGWLTSASTGRVPFVQLIDTAPTVLQALGLDEPASMNGQPMSATAGRPTLAQAVDELERASIRAGVHYRSTSDFFGLLVLATAVVVALGLLTLGGVPRAVPQWLRERLSRHRPGATLRQRMRLLLRPVCLAVASQPAASYLANALPWQDSGSPRAVLAGAVLLTTVGLTAVAALGPWRHRRLGPAVVVLVITLATLVGDVLTGSHLELSALLGYDAIVAGRFTGFGNLTFGLLAVSALLLTSGLAGWVARRAPGTGRRPALLVTLGCGAITVVLVGGPGLGQDFGGVLAAVPGFLLLAMLLTGIRVTVLRLVAILAVAVVAVGSVAVLDWTRPPAQRSHLGRFVAQLLDGQAWTVISRKAGANLGILLGSPLAWTLLVAAIAALWLLQPGGLLRRRPGHLPVADVAVLRAGLLAVALSLALATAVNDSGVAIPATAAVLLVPLLVWLAAAPPPIGATDTGATAAPHADDGGVGGDRVSVSARGSTG